MTKREATAAALQRSGRVVSMFVVRNRALGFGVCTEQELAELRIPRADVVADIRHPE
jgi:hypothetical protein